jgi:insulysin
LENLNISFISKSLKNECNLTEKIYGTKYTKEKLKITQEEIDSYKCDHIFDYPPENKFCPKNLEIFPTGENAPKYPEIILDERNCKVWFLQDNIFKLPKGRLKAEFKFVQNLNYNSELKNRAISHILKKIIKNYLLFIKNKIFKFIYCQINNCPSPPTVNILLFVKLIPIPLIGPS